MRQAALTVVTLARKSDVTNEVVLIIVTRWCSVLIYFINTKVTRRFLLKHIKECLYLLTLKFMVYLIKNTKVLFRRYKNMHANHVTLRSIVGK